jgi:hypothetical protein
MTSATAPSEFDLSSQCDRYVAESDTTCFGGLLLQVARRARLSPSVHEHRILNGLVLGGPLEAVSGNCPAYAAARIVLAG